jgi:hypothetical protein
VGALRAVALLLAALNADRPRPAVLVTLLGEAAYAPSCAVRFGGAVELDFNVMRYGRITIDAAAAWSPPLYSYESLKRGFLRGLVGVDAVLPLESVDLFAGLSSGFTYSNVNPFSKLRDYCLDCGPFNSSLWLVSAALRVRAGVDWYAGSRFTLGFHVAYGLMALFDMHWIEGAARVGVAF